MSKKLKTQYNQKSFLPTEVNTETYEKILKQNNFTGRTIGQVLDIIRTILDNTEKGNKFEKLTQWALPLIKDTEIESVHAPRGQDIGVDLIATDNNNNKIAIQCKFYTTSNITRGDIHAFAAGAKEKQINTKWLVCAASGVSDTAMKYIKDYEIKIIDLRKYRDTILTHKPSPVRDPFNLQEDAINAVVAGFTNAKPGIHGDRRGKLIMACGTGKTFTVLRIAERLVERKANLLFIAPSIALVAQARKEWLDHTTRPLRTLIICSDNTTRYNEDIQPNEITGRVTTKPAEIAEAMTKKIDDGHAQAVFCTYQSLNKLHEAQAKHNAPKFDLAIIDEAHRTTGLLKEDDADKYMLIHDAIKIKADKRLYMTATPRIYKASAARRRAEKDPSIAVVDMDDTTRYGNQFYHLTFKQAVNAERLCDYRVIALGVTETVIGHQLTNTLLNLNNEIDDNSNTGSKRKSKGADAQSVLALGAISLAINGFIKGPSHPDSIPRTIAYANNIRRSRWLERALQESGMKTWVTKTGRRDSGTAKAREIDAKHLDGTSSAMARHSALDWLSGGSSAEPRLITNAQLFTEGVDVPALNAIAFLDPRESKIGTVQAVGRVMRLDPDNPNKKLGYIIVPVILPPGADLLETLKTDKARFQSLGNVLRAMRSHDERFDTDLHVLVGEISAVESNSNTNGNGTIPTTDIEIQQTLLDNETKQALFAQLAKGTGIGNAGKNTADDITIAINHSARILQETAATQLIADTIGTPADNAKDSCTTAALLIANACIMHKRLDETGNLGELTKIETAKNSANPPEALYHAWLTILQKDYSPIFQDSAMLVKRIAPFSQMHDAIHLLIECAMSSATTLNDLGFDHAGPLYHRILGSAQSDGAYYTKNLSGYLLAGLAFDKDFIDWKDPEVVNNLRIIDPACGTGTLLMAALNIIKKRAAAAQNLDEAGVNKLHKRLVENAIYGFDINKYSVQLAACNLTIGAPDTDYERINLHTLEHGPIKGTDGDNMDDVRHGVLEKLFDDDMGNLIEEPPLLGESVSREMKEVVMPHEFSVMIYNPPFTDTQKQARKFTPATMDAMTERLQFIKSTLEERDPAAAKAVGKRSIQPFFTPLTTRLLSKDRGKLAKIIPTTVCIAENARTQRQYLANNFHIEMVVTSHDSKRVNFSENTSINECLVIGRRSADNDKPTRFIQLVAYPNTVKEVEALIEKIQSGDAGKLYSETLWQADRMRDGDWTPVQWFNSNLARAADEITNSPTMIVADKICSVDHNEVAFRLTFDYATGGDDAFCTIAEDIMQTIQAKPESKATPKKDKERRAATLWKEKASRLLVTSRLSTTSTRLMAIHSKKPALGSGYVAVRVNTSEQEKAFAAFLNSSFGVIQLLHRRTKKLTYPSYEVRHLKTLMLPDPNKADLTPLLDAFEQVKDTPLERLAKCAEDPARKILDHAAAKSIGIDPATTDQWRQWLSQEPTITGKLYKQN